MDYTQHFDERFQKHLGSSPTRSFVRRALFIGKSLAKQIPYRDQEKFSCTIQYEGSFYQFVYSPDTKKLITMWPMQEQTNEDTEDVQEDSEVTRPPSV